MSNTTTLHMPADHKIAGVELPAMSVSGCSSPQRSIPCGCRSLSGIPGCSHKPVTSSYYRTVGFFTHGELGYPARVLMVS